MKSLTVCALFVVFELMSCATLVPVDVGDWSDGDLSDGVVQKISTYAISQTAGNGAACAKAFTPTKAESQVLSPLKYRITYNVDPSKCLNNKDAETTTCTVEVISQPPVNNTCKTIFKAGTAGHLPPNDWICVPTSSYYVESISNFAVSQSVVRNHLCPQAYVLASAAERVDVPNYSNYYLLTYIVTPTLCPGVIEGPKACAIEVHDEPWTHIRVVKSDSC